ncbi:MAG: methionine ABC transporter substrate-binding protein, partial [Treponema sp.]|nr:methionine ABC transporter substrate-binding protein [Treponema sp.]
AINGNYALAVGLNSTKDGLVVEGKDSPYVNIVVTKAGRENEDALKALVKALQTPKVRDWVKENYPNGDVVTVF